VFTIFGPPKITKPLSSTAKRDNTVTPAKQVMGGTDLMDQRTSYYGYTHASVRWTHRIFSHFFIVSIVNAYILYRDSDERRSKTVLLDFIEKLLEQLRDFCLYGHHYDRDMDGDDDDDSSDDELPPLVPQQHTVAPKDTTKTYRKNDWMKHIGRLNKTNSHTPCQCSSSRPDERRPCVICGSKSTKYCYECGAFLCVGAAPQYSCWWKFHNNKSL